MGGFDLIVVPDEDDEGGALPYVDGAVGDRVYRFLLDTGAARTSLASDDYTGQFASAGEHRSGGLFGTESIEDLVVAPSIRLGPIERTGMTVTRGRSAPTFGNLVGMDLLVNHRLHFRFDGSRVEVDPTGELGGDDQPLVLDNANHLYVDVSFGDAVGHAVWDTGAGLTIVDLSFTRRCPGHFRETGSSRGTDSTGATHETPSFVMTAAMISGQPFPPHPVAGVDLSRVNATIERPMDFVLGYSTLSQANWWFDFPGRKWKITKLLADSSP